jgi:predicted permease
MREPPIWRRHSRMFGSNHAADVRDELRFHLESKTEELMALGLSRDQARKEAERNFGSVPAVQHIGEQLGARMERRKNLRDYWADCRQDIRYTLRMLRNNPGFAIVSILVLALGIGANVAVFSVIDTMLLRPLPFADSQQLVWFTGGRQLDEKTLAAAGLSGVTYTVDAYQEFQRYNHSFASVAAYQTFYGSLGYKLTGWGQPKQIVAVEVSDNFFPTLGVQASLGRLFTEQECQKGGAPAALLSYFFWKNKFAADPAIVGKVVTINGAPVTVIGVLPASFDFGSVFSPGMQVDLFVPAVMDFWRTWGNTLAIVGRLKPGVTVAQAQAEADQLFPHLKTLHPDWYENYASTLATLKDHVSGKLRRSLVVLCCAVGLILLIVCVNLSNLQLARAAARSKEFAMRLAVGAGRERLIRQLLTESLILSVAGAVVGLVFAYAIIFYLAHQGSITLPLLHTLHIDGDALLWTVVSGLAMGLLFGLAAAVKMSKGNVQESLKDNSSGLASGRSHERFRSTLVITEVALACVLMVGAGLLLRSFLRVLDVDLGFEPTHAAAMLVDLPLAKDDKELGKRAAVFEDIITRVGGLPGVQAAGISDMLPLDRNRSWGLSAVGRDSRDRDTGVLVYLVTPGYLGAIGARLVAGRDFSWHDTTSTQKVVLINEAAARREWPNQSAVGKFADGLYKTPAQVAGVVANLHESSLEQASTPAIYVPMTQNSDAEGATLIVRSKVDPDSLAAPVLETLRATNPEQPANEFRPLKSLVDHSVSPRRFFVVLVGTFAVLGVLLAALGVYGVISYSVTQRTSEIGLRMALGATGGRVQRDVLWDTLRLALTGVALGTIASLAAARLIYSLLFDTSVVDPFTYIWMALALTAVALLAGFLPARRASRIEPMAALRSH